MFADYQRRPSRRRSSLLPTPFIPSVALILAQTDLVFCRCPHHRTWRSSESAIFNGPLSILLHSNFTFVSLPISSPVKLGWKFLKSEPVRDDVCNCEHKGLISTIIMTFSWWNEMTTFSQKPLFPMPIKKKSLRKGHSYKPQWDIVSPYEIQCPWMFNPFHISDKFPVLQFFLFSMNQPCKTMLENLPHPVQSELKESCLWQNLPLPIAKNVKCERL